MNTYYGLIETIKETFELDSRVSTIVTGDSSDLDTYKKNIYPLVHVNVTDSPFIGLETTAVTRYTVEITVVDIRDVNKEIVNEKFWLNDNRHDVWNETMSILKTATNILVKDVNQTGINISESGSAQILSFHKENTLDGWQQTWTLDVPDTYTKVCC